MSDELVELLIRLHLAHAAGQIDTVIHFVLFAGEVEVELADALHLFVDVVLRANLPQPLRVLEHGLEYGLVILETLFG